MKKEAKEAKKADLGQNVKFGREKGRKTKPPQERRARKTANVNKFETSRPVAIRYTDHFYSQNENSDRLPITRLLQSKLDREIEVVIGGEVVKGIAKDIVTDNIIRLACEGDKWAIELLLNRIEGKSVERIDMGNGTLPTNLVEFLYSGAYGGHGNDENSGL